MANNIPIDYSQSQLIRVEDIVIREHIVLPEYINAKCVNSLLRSFSDTVLGQPPEAPKIEMEQLQFNFMKE